MEKDKRYRIVWTHKKNGAHGRSRELTRNFAHELCGKWNDDRTDWVHRVVEA